MPAGTPLTNAESCSTFVRKRHTRVRVRAWAAPHRPRDALPSPTAPALTRVTESPSPSPRSGPTPPPRRAPLPAPPTSPRRPSHRSPAERARRGRGGTRVSPTWPPGDARFEPAGPPDGQPSAARSGGNAARRFTDRLHAGPNPDGHPCCKVHRHQTDPIVDNPRNTGGAAPDRRRLPERKHIMRGATSWSWPRRQCSIALASRS